MKIPQKILFSKQDFSQRQRPSLTTDHIHSNTYKPVTPISTKVNKNQQPHTYGHSRKHIPTATFRINSKRQKKKKKKKKKRKKKKKKKKKKKISSKPKNKQRTQITRDLAAAA